MYALRGWRPPSAAWTPAKNGLAGAAASQIWRGWAWLVLDGNDLKRAKTANAEVPLTMGMKPLLTVDVWDHAHYLDRKSRRVGYGDVVLKKLINLAFALQNAA